MYLYIYSAIVEVACLGVCVCKKHKLEYVVSRKEWAENWYESSLASFSNLAQQLSRLVNKLKMNSFLLEC